MMRFRKRVEYTDRKAMVEFLKGHFQYFTMNSWNLNTSYANNVKVFNLGLDSDEESRLLDIMDAEGAHDAIDGMITDFGHEHGWEWQAGFNGRSGGYLVLYKGGRRPVGYKSYCTECGQMNYTSVEETGCRCGRCGRDARVNYVSPVMEIYTTGEGVDMGEDFEDWDDERLLERVKLVQDFDRLCDRIARHAKWMANNVEVEEAEELVPVTRRRVAAE